eukprot:7091351-Prymnesium_polylepis.1
MLRESRADKEERKMRQVVKRQKQGDKPEALRSLAALSAPPLSPSRCASRQALRPSPLHLVASSPLALLFDPAARAAAAPTTSATPSSPSLRSSSS